MKSPQYRNLFTILFLFIGLSVSAQGFWNNMKSGNELADRYYEEGKFNKAIELYNHLIENGRANNTVYLRLGRMNYNLKDYEESVKCFEKYQNRAPLPQDDHLMYANALAGSGRLSQAADTYNSYIDRYGSNDWLALKVWRLNNLSYLYEDSLTYSVTPMSINTKYSEFPVAYYNDGLLIISDQGKGFKLKNHTNELTGRSPYGLYYTAGVWTTGYTDGEVEIEPSALIKHGGYHVAGVSFLPASRELVYAKNVKMTDGEKQPLQLYIKKLNDNHEGNRLSFGDTRHSVKHPSISPDGKLLYFSAEFPDGYGGFDIYKSLYENGKWSEAINLGPNVNTPGNEAFPYIHSSGSLYFASEGLPGFGGYDLFKVESDVENAEPQNLGYPINSSADDFSIILNEIGDRGHFASNRKNGGLDDDVYVVEVDLQEYPLTIQGLLKFKNFDSEPVVLPNTDFEVIENNTQQSVYQSKSSPLGAFEIEIPYASQFFIKLKLGDAEPLVVSLDIPKNKDKQANHEIVVVSSRYIPLQQTDNH